MLDMARNDLGLDGHRRPGEEVSGGELPARHLRRSKTQTRRRRGEAPRVGPRGVAVRDVNETRETRESK